VSQAKPPEVRGFKYLLDVMPLLEKLHDSGHKGVTSRSDRRIINESLPVLIWPHGAPAQQIHPASLKSLAKTIHERLTILRLANDSHLPFAAVQNVVN
jgi:hypothetical protein